MAPSADITVISVELIEGDHEVFDIEVDEDHSFIVAGCVVHNSNVCKGRAGKSYKHGAGPLPPAHAGCRSAVYNLVPGVPAADDIGYETFLNRQDAATQRDILGPARYKLWKQGGLKIDRFTDGGRSLTLDQLRTRDAEAFRKAGF